MLDRPTVCLSYFNPCPYVCPSSFPPIRITFIQQPKRLIISSLFVCLSLCPSAHPHVYPYIYKRSYHAENVLFAQTHFNLFYILSSMPKHAKKNAKCSTYNKRMANKNTEKVYAYMFVARRYETKLITLL